MAFLTAKRMFIIQCCTATITLGACGITLWGALHYGSWACGVLGLVGFGMVVQDIRKFVKHRRDDLALDASVQKTLAEGRRRRMR